MERHIPATVYIFNDWEMVGVDAFKNFMYCIVSVIRLLTLALGDKISLKLSSNSDHTHKSPSTLISAPLNSKDRFLMGHNFIICINILIILKVQVLCWKEVYI